PDFRFTIPPMKSIRDLPLDGKRLFLRVDFNVPLADGKVLDTTRIEETLPTIRYAVDRGARIACASHLGKPKGKSKPELSPALVAEKGAGFLLEKEVRELSRLLQPQRPFAAILGGAKISGKIDTLRVLSRRADTLLLGGGIANHFVRAIGLSVGRSLLEEEK